MKVINREEFLALEGEVVFATVYPDNSFGGLEVKAGNVGKTDYCSDTLGAEEVSYQGGSNEYFNELEKALSGVDVPLTFDDCTTRAALESDGVEKYAVFSRKDVETLRNRLNAVLERTCD